MSEQKHTPGPWRVGDECVEIFGADGKHVVWEMWHGHSCTRQHADAHLIAAAPDLLAALKLAYEGVMGRHIEGLPSTIRAAIAKAEGRK